MICKILNGVKGEEEKRDFACAPLSYGPRLGPMLLLKPILDGISKDSPPILLHNAQLIQEFGMSAFCVGQSEPLLSPLHQ